MAHDSRLLSNAIELRKQGYSFEEISNKLTIAKSSAYSWCKGVVLDEKAKKRIKKRLAYGMFKAKEVLKAKRNGILHTITDNVDIYLSDIKDNKEINKLLCAFLFWGEGEKTTSSVRFINSDPLMIKSFLTLLRSSYKLDERKFRVLVHVHEYHNEVEIKKFWSEITKIPLNQFSKSYLKPHTKKTIRNGYKGAVSVRYYDYRIALELSFIYNRFANSLI